jgi:hypothetical protein
MPKLPSNARAGHFIVLSETKKARIPKDPGLFHPLISRRISYAVISLLFLRNAIAVPAVSKAKTITPHSERAGT